MKIINIVVPTSIVLALIGFLFNIMAYAKDLKHKFHYGDRVRILDKKCDTNDFFNFCDKVGIVVRAETNGRTMEIIYTVKFSIPDVDDTETYESEKDLIKSGD